MNLNKNYHEDELLRVANERHAGFVIKDGKILLMHRIKDKEEYYVIPGGHRRIDEKGEEVVIREIEEETAIKAINPKLAFEFKNYHNNNYDFYYICDWVSGLEPRLNGEEAIRNCEENLYEPMWFDLTRVHEIPLYPTFAKEFIVRNFK